MKCVICNNNLILTKTTIKRKIFKGRILYIKNIPVDKCSNCGEIYLDKKESYVIEKWLQKLLIDNGICEIEYNELLETKRKEVEITTVNDVGTFGQITKAELLAESEEYDKDKENIFTFISKNVPTKFVILQGVEIKADSLYFVLEEFIDNDEMTDYDLDKKIVDVLVKEGILNKRMRYKNSSLYSKTQKFDSFYDTYMEEYLNNNQK